MVSSLERRAIRLLYEGRLQMDEGQELVFSTLIQLHSIVHLSEDLSREGVVKKVLALIMCLCQSPILPNLVLIVTSHQSLRSM